MEIISITIYTLLFLMAFIPPLLGKKPFTYYVSKGAYSSAIIQSEIFLKINRRLSFIWAGLFALAFLLVQIKFSPYSAENILLSNGVAFLPQILIGIPLSVFLPKIMMKSPSARLHFDTIKDAFESMPYGLNKEMARDVDVVVQFDLSGEEAGVRHLIIKDQVCTQHQGGHSDPTLIITADSKLWLDITNGDVDGTDAFLTKKYTLEGDASIMQKFEKLFDASALEEEGVERIQDYNYKTIHSKKIKNIVVFDGGMRNKKLSKTTLMVDEFIRGAITQGANVESFKLSELDISLCDGCYTCWSKTPGECVHKDSMTELREKYRNADLIVFASPLFIFNVTGIMKSFMDRLLPILEPYMLLDEQGHISHPDRYPERGEQGFVVFSAAGFPDVDNNFDGLKGMYRAWDSHNENTHLMGEFFLTAAEVLAQPIYKNRRESVKEVCYKAGIQVVQEGKIDFSLMASVSNTGITNKTFQKQADNFWATLDAKKAYLRAVPKL